jgi:hypothetical protein
MAPVDAERGTGDGSPSEAPNEPNVPRCEVGTANPKKKWTDVTTLVKLKPGAGAHVAVAGRVEREGERLIVGSVCRGVQDEAGIVIHPARDTCMNPGDVVVIEATVTLPSLVAQMLTADGAGFELSDARALGMIPLEKLCRRPSR